MDDKFLEEARNYLINEISIPQGQVDSFISNLSDEFKKREMKAVDNSKNNIISELQTEYNKEDDWRKKAKIAARIASLGYSDG